MQRLISSCSLVQTSNAMETILLTTFISVSPLSLSLSLCVLSFFIPFPPSLLFTRFSLFLHVTSASMQCLTSFECSHESPCPCQCKQQVRLTHTYESMKSDGNEYCRLACSPSYLFSPLYLICYYSYVCIVLQSAMCLPSECWSLTLLFYQWSC